MDSFMIIVIISVLGPILGSVIGVIQKPSKLFMYNMLSFAAGVMIAVSFLELIPESIEFSSIGIAVAGIIVGSWMMFVLERMLPRLHPELSAQREGCNPLKKTAIYLLLAIFIHNFPEGMAIAIGSITSTKVSLVVAIAIAMQNIPEGICTSYPYFHCTGKRLKAFLLSSTTAIPILIGFLAGHFLYQSIPLRFVGFIIAATAGIMIYISADELIPNSCHKLTDHTTIIAFVIGVIFVMLLGYI